MRTENWKTIRLDHFRSMRAAGHGDTLSACGLAADSRRCAVANSGQSGRMRLGPVVNRMSMIGCASTSIGPCRLWMGFIGPLHAQIVPNAF